MTVRELIQLLKLAPEGAIVMRKVGVHDVAICSVNIQRDANAGGFEWVVFK